MPHLFTSDTHPNQSNQEGTGNHSIYGKSGDCLQAFYLRKQANTVCPILGFASLALRPKIRFQSRYYLPKIQESWSRPLSGIQIPTINVPSFHSFRFLWSPWDFCRAHHTPAEPHLKMVSVWSEDLCLMPDKSGVGVTGSGMFHARSPQIKHLSMLGVLPLGKRLLQWSFLFSSMWFFLGL